jgi:hypothetical protein
MLNIAGQAGKSMRNAISEAKSTVTDLVKSDTPPTGSDLMSESSNKTIRKIGDAVDIVDKAKDAGEMIIEYGETDFNDPEQTGDFIEKSVQKGVEQAPIVGDAAEIIMDDSKKSDGLTNLKSKRLSNDYKGSFNQRDAWLQQHGAQNRNQNPDPEQQ